MFFLKEKGVKKGIEMSLGLKVLEKDKKTWSKEFLA